MWFRTHSYAWDFSFVAIVVAVVVAFFLVLRLHRTNYRLRLNKLDKMNNKFWIVNGQQQQQQPTKQDITKWNCSLQLCDWELNAHLNGWFVSAKVTTFNAHRFYRQYNLRIAIIIIIILLCSVCANASTHARKHIQTHICKWVAEAEAENGSFRNHNYCSFPAFTLL